MGRKVSNTGIAPNNEELPMFGEPKSEGDVRTILGSLQYISKFISNFSEIMMPLNSIICKEAEFKWTKEHKNALHTVQKHLREAKKQPKIVELYAIPQSIEAVCTDTAGNLIERASKALSESESNYTHVERTLLALALACSKFEPFLCDENTVQGCTFLPNI